MKIINKILCKTTDFVCGLAEFVGMAVKIVIIRAFSFAVGISVLLLGYAVGMSALFLWMSVPYFICGTLFSDINSLWQVYAMIGIVVGWFILGKFLLDRLGDSGRNKSTLLDKFFEELDKEAAVAHKNAKAQLSKFKKNYWKRT